MHLQVDTIPSKVFSHFPNSKRLVAEVSDLPGFEGFKPLYDDACDVGLALRNTNTGNITRWAMADQIIDNDGDTQGWYLVPCTESIRKNPVLEGYCITLIND